MRCPILLALVLGWAPAHAGSIGCALGPDGLSPPPSASRFDPSPGYPDAGGVDPGGSARVDLAATDPGPIGSCALDPTPPLGWAGIGGPFQAGFLTPGPPESVFAGATGLVAAVRLEAGLVASVGTDWPMPLAVGHPAIRAPVPAGGDPRPASAVAPTPGAVLRSAVWVLAQLAVVLIMTEASRRTARTRPDPPRAKRAPGGGTVPAGAPDCIPAPS